IRLQRFLADAGVASRRGGEQYIRDGRVTVNGRLADVPGVKVDPANDDVRVDGAPVRAARKIYAAFHKPCGCICSRRDERGRPTVYRFLPKEWQSVVSVGRLDFQSEGLLFFTNDGQFALRLTHPRHGVRKKYVATVEGRVERSMLQQLVRGVGHQGQTLRAERAELLQASDACSAVELELGEGKNREVRRMFETQGLVVKRLQRTQIGKIKLGDLKPGRWRMLTETEIKTLLEKT
ncbi:MAG: rRNA pseudouridine synthase, partial [Verrucomicrobia bacterium]|nr:rRNA pseudouridine synthase [Verrucomicrobiota bacterium]